MIDNKKDGIDKQIHLGRRKKLRARFVREGLTSFSESEVLEFALGFCIPRLDTNPTAHRLLNKFGTLKNVLDANPTILREVAGIGENLAIFITFLKHLTGYMTTIELKQAKIKSIQDAVDYFRPLMKTYTVEEFILLCLSRDGTILLMETFTNKDINKVNLNMREILALLLRVNTASVIVAHNHLSNDPTPSNADMFLTRQLTRLCLALDIEPIDHLIFSCEKYYSFTEMGIMSAFKTEYAQMLSAPVVIPQYTPKLNTIPAD
jgi:DNA repair protein RadC